MSSESLTVIETSRVRLEPLRAAHADALYVIYCEPAVQRFLITCPASRADFDLLFDRALGFATTHGMWAVVDTTTSAIMGRVGFFAFGESARPELAFLLSQRFWGRGLATEASSAALRHGFRRHGWPEVVALVRPANAAAIRVLSKLGMRREDTIALGSAPAVVYRVTSGEFSILPVV